MNWRIDFPFRIEKEMSEKLRMNPKKHDSVYKQIKKERRK